MSGWDEDDDRLARLGVRMAWWTTAVMLFVLLMGQVRWLLWFP